MPNTIVLLFKLLKDSEQVLNKIVGDRPQKLGKGQSVSNVSWHRRLVLFNSYVLTLVYIIIWVLMALYRYQKHRANRLYRQTNMLLQPNQSTRHQLSESNPF